jgi:maleylpyruvate isomerase
MTPNYRLHNYWRSSASYRVRIGFGLKGLPYEYVAVNITAPGGGEQRTDAYRAMNPQMQVPTLEVPGPDGPRFLGQSLAILEYLDEVHPDRPRLLPPDPMDRARARQIAEAVNAGIQPLQNIPVMAEVERLGGDRTAWARHWNERGLEALERLVAYSAGQFAVGDTASIADCCVVPQLYGARRFGVDTSRFPTLTRVERACLALDAFARAAPERQPDAASA